MFEASLQRMRLEVDLERRECVRALLSSELVPEAGLGAGHRELGMHEALTIVWFDLITAAHVKTHALGNWAVAAGGGRLAAATVFYNYAGFTAFPRITRLLHALGVLPAHYAELRRVFERGTAQGALYCSHETEKSEHGAVRQHRKMAHDLRAHSRHVAFVARLRPTLMRPVCCTPWTTPQQLLADPLWLEAGHEEWGRMAVLGQLVR